MARDRVRDADAHAYPFGGRERRRGSAEHRSVLTALGKRHLVEAERVGSLRDRERVGERPFVRQRQPEADEAPLRPSPCCARRRISALATMCCSHCSTSFIGSMNRSKLDASAAIRLAHVAGRAGDRVLVDQRVGKQRAPPRRGARRASRCGWPRRARRVRPAARGSPAARRVPCTRSGRARAAVARARTRGTRTTRPCSRSRAAGPPRAGSDAGRLGRQHDPVGLGCGERLHPRAAPGDRDRHRLLRPRQPGGADLAATEQRAVDLERFTQRGVRPFGDQPQWGEHATAPYAEAVPHTTRHELGERRDRGRRGDRMT